MKRRSDSPPSWEAEREKIIGLGERSLRKTYYPELQQKLDELERFRALLDQSNDCIFLLRIPSLAFLDVNESACRQLGCTREEILSHPLERFIPEEAAVRVRELVAFGHAEGKDQDTIVTHLRSCSGEDLPVEITLRLVTFNREFYGVAVARDITERLRAEKVLLETSRLRRDMELARQIQLSLLPAEPPQLAGVRLAGCCVPAAHVGGDYFDYYEREAGVVDLVIADVSGHSVGAALMMAEARSVLRAQMRSHGSAGKILASLNEILLEDLSKAGLFITMFYVKFDTDSQVLTYANAGHVLPMLVRGRDPSCLRLDAEGLILGVKGGIVFEERELRLQAGDVLLLHTDGIVEARNDAGEMFGFARLCTTLATAREAQPQEIIDTVLAELAAFAGTTVCEDDVTMIAMQVV